MKYRIVQNIEDVFVCTEVDDISAWAKVRGIKQVSVVPPKPPQAKLWKRQELIGQPVFDQLCGPMWDGNAVRYEDARANAILSI